MLQLKVLKFPVKEMDHPLIVLNVLPLRKINHSVTTFIFIIFLMFLTNHCFASGHMEKHSDSSLRFSSAISGEFSNDEWKREDIQKQIVGDDTIAEVMRGKQWGLERWKNLEELLESENDSEETAKKGATENEDKRNEGNGHWVQGGDALMKRNRSLHVTEAINRKRADAKHLRLFRSKVGRNHRRRHNTHLEKQIENLHEELSQVITNLDNMTKKETALEQEIDELRRLSEIKKLAEKQRGYQDVNNEQRLDIGLPQRGNGNKYLSKSSGIKRVPDAEADGIIDITDSLEADRKLGSLENEDQDLYDQNIGREWKLLEEITRLQEKIEEVLSKNRELHGKNKELRRQLCESMTKQESFNGRDQNGELNRKLDSVSGETAGNLEEEIIDSRCAKFFPEEVIKHHKRRKPHLREDREKQKSAHLSDGDFRKKVKRINRKNKTRRQFLRNVSNDQNLYGRRRTHNHDAEDLKTGLGRTIQDERKLELWSGAKKELKLHDYILDSENVQMKGKLTVYEDEGRSHTFSSNVFDDKEDKRSSPLSKKVTDKSAEDFGNANDNDFSEKGDVDLRIGGKFPEEEGGEANFTVSIAEEDGEANFTISTADEDGETNFTISTAEEDREKVYDHIASVDDVIFCGKPQPVVIYPADQYPFPNKYYTPQGTILHRCSNHSGCCPNEHLTCVPAKKEKVVLHFFAAVLEGATSVVPHVEKLQFINHTKCGCVFKHHAHYYF